MAKKEARKSLVQLAQSEAPPPNGRSRTWFDRVPPDVQAELLDLRRAHQAHELGGWSPRQLYEILLPRLGIKISCTLPTWQKWCAE